MIRTHLGERLWVQLCPLDMPIDIKGIFKCVYLKIFREICVTDTVWVSSVIKTVGINAITLGKKDIN